MWVHVCCEGNISILARILGRQWEVLKFDPSIMRVVILHSIDQEETLILPWLSPWHYTINKWRRSAVSVERHPSAFSALWTTYLWRMVFWESFKVAHWHNTLFWIAIQYATWSPAIACWGTCARCLEFWWGAWKNWTTDEQIYLLFW